MRIGYLQFRPRFGDPDGNCRRVVDALTGVRADLIVLPELAFTGYLFSGRRELRALAEEPSHSTVVDSLVDLCREHQFHVVAGFAEKAKDKLFNSALLIGPRGLVQTYRKLHLFNDEKRWFDPGDLPLEPKRVGEARVGMMVCFDWAFPETARTLALRGADVVCHPSNLVLDHCQRVMLARSLENSVYSVTANRIGEERREHGSLRFTGQSQIVGPRGELLHAAGPDREELQVAEIDLSLARNKKLTPRNHLVRDRRPEFYC